VEWSPDGQSLASFADDRTVRLWNAATGESRVLATAPNDVIHLDFSPDGKRLAWSSGYERLTIYDLVRGAVGCVIDAHNQAAFAFSPDGASVVYGDARAVRLADAATCTGRELYQHAGWIQSVIFSADGQRVASASDKRVGLYSLGGSGARLLTGHTRDVIRVRFSADGALLASASSDYTVRLWNGTSGAPLRILEGHDAPVRFIAFAPSGAILVSAGVDRAVRLWATATGESRVLRGHNAMIDTMDLSPDGRLAVTADEEGAVRLWPVELGGGLPEDTDHLRTWLAASTTARIDARDQVSTP
jgi:WD40 repeat protein